ncbi:hypothetical protein PRIPAC_72116 [Pristionchus pacificus]|uniref:Uncharacterized protein n=1 Tax=Pristionchus pacificus TaxID=54126 RepID=A0A2A6D0H2_PRIPA|nr:hypothetical protein PRIPAC_72116 [Pristionchus pacificus]|eukprot:PDM83846.1 hypothetical protein PRIPAC_30333 [Pristionchus pacificus]
MECALFYYQVMACPLLCLPIVYLLIRIKMSRLMEHSNTFYHFFIWMEILSIAFIILNAVNVVLEGAKMGDLEYLRTLLLFFIRLLFLSSSLITPLVTAAAVPKSTRMWNEMFFRCLLIVSLILPAIVNSPTLVLTKDETLPRNDIKNVEFTTRLIFLLCCFLISIGSVPIVIYGAIHVEWAGESKTQLRDRNGVVVGAAAVFAHALDTYSYIMNNTELSKTVDQTSPIINSLVLFIPPLLLILIVPSIRDALRGRTKTARRLSLLP